MAMNVGELMKILKDYPKKLPIVLMIDPEGNGWHNLDGYTPGRVVTSEFKWGRGDHVWADDEGDYVDTEEKAECKRKGEPFEPFDDRKEVLVLCP